MVNYERQIYKIYEIQVRQRSVVIIPYLGRIDFYGAGCIYQDRDILFPWTSHVHIWICQDHVQEL